MKVHQALAQALIDHDVSTVFGVIGDANLFFADSFMRSGAGTYVAAAHEASAVLMANGHAAISGRLGVATITHGPALTNAATAMVESARNRNPLLVVCGDTPSHARHHLQDIAQREVVLSTGAGFEPVRSAQTVLEDVAHAIRRTLTERRTIVLDIPADIQWNDVDYAPLRLNRVEQQIAPDPAALDAAVGIIATARRPLIVAGGGAIAPGARSALLRLADRLGAPVATTLMAKDLFSGYKADLGIFGTFSTPAAVEIIGSSDCVIAFGASLNPWTTVQGSLLTRKRVVHIDVSPEAIGAIQQVDAGVVGDVAPVSDTFIEWLDRAAVTPSDFASSVQARFETDREADYDDQSTDTTVDVRTALLRLDAPLDADRVLVIDGGRFGGEVIKRLHVQDPRRWIYTWRGFASIGLGSATAIGASYGAAGSPVLLVTGDGGFMMGGLTEFNTAVRHGVDLVVVVCNDGAYGAEHIQFRDRGLDPAISLFAWPDLAPLADALGGQGVTVRCLADVDAAADAIKHRDRPMLIDVKLHPDHVPDVPHISAAD